MRCRPCYYRSRRPGRFLPALLKACSRRGGFFLRPYGSGCTGRKGCVRRGSCTGRNRRGRRSGCTGRNGCVRGGDCTGRNGCVRGGDLTSPCARIRFFSSGSGLTCFSQEENRKKRQQNHNQGEKNQKRPAPSFFLLQFLLQCLGLQALLQPLFEIIHIGGAKNLLMRGMASATVLLRIDFSTSTQPQISNLPGQINRLFVDFDLILLHQLRQGKDTGCLFLSWKRSKQRMVRIFPHGTVFKGDVYEERNKHCRSVV